MGKVPWGIIAGICAMVVFFATAGVIVVFIALNHQAHQTSDTVTLFQYWYQVLLFSVDAVAALGLIGSLVMYGKRTKDGQGTKGEAR